MDKTAARNIGIFAAVATGVFAFIGGSVAVGLANRKKSDAGPIVSVVTGSVNSDAAQDDGYHGTRPVQVPLQDFSKVVLPDDPQRLSEQERRRYYKQFPPYTRAMIAAMAGAPVDKRSARIQDGGFKGTQGEKYYKKAMKAYKDGKPTRVRVPSAFNAFPPGKTAASTTIGEWIDHLDGSYVETRGRAPKTYIFAGMDLRKKPKDVPVSRFMGNEWGNVFVIHREDRPTKSEFRRLYNK